MVEALTCLLLVWSEMESSEIGPGWSMMERFDLGSDWLSMSASSIIVRVGLFVMLRSYTQAWKLKVIQFLKATKFANGGEGSDLIVKVGY
jgi:hypothetical protein